MNLPDELTSGADLRGNEYGWPPNEFPAVLSKAESAGFACLGGQFQFRTTESVCEMYWLEADATDRLINESWNDYVTRSNAEVLSAFSALISTTDFRNEAQQWSNVPELSGIDASPEQYLYFVAYFISNSHDT